MAALFDSNTEILVASDEERVLYLLFRSAFVVLTAAAVRAAT
jgi:hypothetical protein